MILSDLIRAVADVFYKTVPAPATAGAAKTAAGEFDPWGYDTNANCYIDESEADQATTDWMNDIITMNQAQVVINLYAMQIPNPACAVEIHGLYMIFWNIGYFFATIGWDTLTAWFSNAAQFCKDISGNLNGAADTLDDWWVTISQTASDLSSLWNYAYGWLTDKATSAYNTASTAITRANQAINDAATAFQKAIDAAAAALAEAKAYAETLIPDIATWVTSHALDIYNAIAQYLTDILAWVTSHGLDIYNAVKEYIAEFVFVVEDYITAIWDALKGLVAEAIAAQLAIIAAPINLINTWFDDIQSFFNDPWDWLEAKFTDWFLGPE